MLLLSLSSSIATGGHIAPAVLGHGIRADPKFFGGRGRWRADLATNLHRKAFDSCKLSVRPQTSTGAPPLAPSSPGPLCRPWLQSTPLLLNTGVAPYIKFPLTKTFSRTAVKFPDICRFSTQAVTLVPWWHLPRYRDVTEGYHWRRCFRIYRFVGRCCLWFDKLASDILYWILYSVKCVHCTAV